MANKHKPKKRPEDQKPKKKKKKAITPDARLLVVFDRSASMQSMWTEAVNGYESFVNDQKKVPGKAWLTTAMFDSPGAPIFTTERTLFPRDPGYHLAHDNVPLAEADASKVRLYPPRNSTALYDAIGKTVNDALAMPVKRGSKTMLIIITDGEENSSKEFSHDTVTALIKKVQSKEGGAWEVIFLGANIDAKKTAVGLGILRSKSATFEATGRGATVAASTVNLMATSYRGANTMAAMDAYASIDVADVYETEKKKADTVATTKTS